MQVKDLTARLQSACPALKHVAGAADFAVAEKLLRHQLPAAFVIPLEDQAGANTLVGLVEQRVVQRFGVLLACVNLRTAGGSEALDDLDAIRTEVTRAMLGWQVSDAAPMHYVAGRLLGLSEEVLWWQDDFETHIYLRSA